MSVASRYLSCSLGVLLLLPGGLARGDGREGVEEYRSGEATVSLEWFAPADRGRFPTVVLLHPSGGMDPGTAAIFRATGRDFAERGYVVLIPRYFERTGHIAGAALKDGELSAFVKAVEDGVEFGIASGIVDEDRIGVLGYSMGAYIAFSRAARDPRIKAVVSCSGSLPVESRATFPPVLILQGSNDRSSPVSRLAKFQEALKAKGTPCASHIYKGMGHNFDLERWEDAMSARGPSSTGTCEARRSRRDRRRRHGGGMFARNPAGPPRPARATRSRIPGKWTIAIPSSPEAPSRRRAVTVRLAGTRRRDRAAGRANPRAPVRSSE